RLAPPPLEAIATRLTEIDWTHGGKGSADLLAFFHPATLAQIQALRSYLIERESAGRLDAPDEWIRMVAVNRLTGHSPGFLSVYTLPPNQALSLDSQRKINAKRNQAPPRRDVAALILRKTKALLADGPPPAHPAATLLTRPAYQTPELRDGGVDLVVTSPPFLDVVDYEGDNWLRCWFAGIKPKSVQIASHKEVHTWEAFVR